MLPKLAGVHRVRWKRKSGQTVTYHYAWRGGPKFWTEPDDGRDGRAYQAAFKAVGEAPEPTSRNTIARLVDLYLDSGEYASLKPRTQKDYRVWGLRFAKEFGDAEMAVLEDKRFRGCVMEWRDNWKHSPKQAQYAWAVANLIASWGYKKRGLIGPHVLTGGSAIYKAARAELVWTEADIALFDRAPDWVRRIVICAAGTGLRRGDLVRLSRSHFQGDAIRIRTGKRDRVATVPVLRSMRDVLRETPSDRLYILSTEGGAPLKPNRATQVVRYWGNNLGLNPDLRLNDLRGTFATRALREGVKLDKLAPLMGWSLRYAQTVIENYVAVDPNSAAELLPILERAQNKNL